MHISSTQILMNVRQTTHVMSMQTVMIPMAATGVSAGQDSWEMDTTAQVDQYMIHIHVCSIIRGGKIWNNVYKNKCY